MKAEIFLAAFFGLGCLFVAMFFFEAILVAAGR